MSGRYAKVYRAIWSDSDFTSLDVNAQRLYLVLVSQPDISNLGVLAITVRRWASFAPDTTADDISAALIDLEAAKFVITDPDTEELLVRTYLVHDEQFKNTNGAKGLVAAYREIVSPSIRKAVAMVASSVGINLTEGPPQGPRKGPSQAPTQRYTELQQTADSNKRPKTADSRQQTRPTTKAPRLQAVTDTEPLPAAAAAAVTRLIEHRLRSESVRNPVMYRRSLERAIPAEHGDALIAYLDDHPDAEPLELLEHVFGITMYDLARTGSL